MTASYGMEKCRHGMFKATCGYCLSRTTRQTASLQWDQFGSRTEIEEDLLDSYVPALRERLIQAARARTVVYYGEIMNQFGGRGHIGKVLDEVNRRQHALGQPLLSALVVLKDTGRPSEGFWVLFEEMFPGRSRIGFWEAECERIWSYQW